MLIENVLGDELDDEGMEIQVCVAKNVTKAQYEKDGLLQPMNHEKFIFFSTGYMFFWTLMFGLFFNTKLKRTMADRGELDIDVNNKDEENSNSIKCDANKQLAVKPESNGNDTNIELSELKMPLQVNV